MTSLEEERKLKVLLVDDSIDDREHFFDLIDEAQVSDFLIQEVDNASLALEKLIAETFDCVVVDYNMPGHNGIWLIEEIGKRELEVASILLTGGGSEKLAVESLKTGTQDYLSKADLEAKSLAQSIRAAVVRKNSEMRIIHRATCDPLTGLSNRESFMEAMETAWSKAERFGRKFAVLFLDLNKFKQINDTYGHLAGDHTLKEFAGRIRQCARDYDTVARFSGDEFVVLLEELEDDGFTPAIHVAERIAEQVSSKKIRLENAEISISASIGVALYPASSTDKNQLIELADLAMYEAKRSGGGVYVTQQSDAKASNYQPNLN